MTSKNWWNDYFKEGWQYIRPFAKEEEDTILEVAFIEMLMERFDYQNVLDVPCDAGRIAIPLATRNKKWSVSALDLNELALAKGKEIATEKNVSLNWIQGDMQNMPFVETFDLVMCLFGSFGYFDDVGNEAFIASASKSLRKGGRFLLDTHVLETLLTAFQANDFWRFEDCIVLEERTWNFPTSSLLVDWTIFKGKERFEHQTQTRFYTYQELFLLLDKYGFGNFEMYSNFEGEEFDFGAERLILIAEKM